MERKNGEVLPEYRRRLWTMVVEKPQGMSHHHVMLRNDIWAEARKSRDAHRTSDHPAALSDVRVCHSISDVPVGLTHGAQLKPQHPACKIRLSTETKYTSPQPPATVCVQLLYLGSR